MDHFRMGAMAFAALAVGLPACSPSADTPTAASEQNQESPSKNSFAVENVAIFDGETLLASTSVLIVDGRIASTGNDTPSNIPVVDGTDHTLMPGLIDAHVHAFSREGLVDAQRFGVTTVLDHFTMTSVLNAQKPDRVAFGETDAAAMFSAGTLVTTEGGHGTQFGLPIPTISSADEAEAFVESRLAEGSDWIKIVYEPNSPIFQSIDKDTLVAVIDAAQSRDVLAVVHISTLAAAKDAIDAGADGLVHIFSDAVADAETVAEIADSGMFVIPTLSVIASASGNGLAAEQLEDSAFEPFLSSMQKTNLGTSFGSPAAFESLFRLETALENVRLLHEAGVPILAGTDAPNPGTAYGVSMHGELELLVRAGLTPSEALTAATSAPAKAFGLKTRGHIATDARADLILVNGDPTVDFQAVRNIKALYRNGFPSPRTTEAPPTSEVTTTSASAAGTPPLEQGIVSKFDDDLSSGFNVPWVVTTDQLANGTSTAAVTYDTNGFMNVQGEVTTKFLFPWAGAGVFFSQDFSTGYDMTSYSKISFRAKGNPRTLSLMFFTRTSTQRPATVTFNITEEWETFSFDLSDIRGLAADEVYGFAVTAGRPKGPYSFDLDDIVFSAE